MERINLPLSKSILIRAMALEYVFSLVRGRDFVSPAEAVLPEGITLGSTPCDDVIRFSEALRQLAHRGSVIRIGDGAAPLRFLTAIAASIPECEVIIEPSEQLGKRPHTPLFHYLETLGANLIPEYDAEGKCLKRIYIKGRLLEGGAVTVDPSLSSQYVSALLIASPLMKTPPDIIYCKGKPEVSVPYILMTRRMLEAVRKCESPYSLLEYDWSAASYFYEWAMLNPDIPVSLSPLTLLSLQGDAAVAKLFGIYGVETRFNDFEENLHFTTIRGKRIGLSEKRGEIPVYDFSAIPDLVPAFATALCAAGESFRLTGVGHLHHKETDRLLLLCNELGKLGLMLRNGTSCDDDGSCQEYLEFDATKSEKFTTVRKRMEESAKKGEMPVVLDSHGDHRLAMAFTPLLSEGIVLRGEEAVAKSFPDFKNEYIKLTSASLLRMPNDFKI